MRRRFVVLLVSPVGAEPRPPGFMIDLTTRKNGDRVYFEARDEFGAPVVGTIYRIGMIRTLANQRMVGHRQVFRHPALRMQSPYSQGAIVQAPKGALHLVPATVLHPTREAAAAPVLLRLRESEARIMAWIAEDKPEGGDGDETGDGNKGTTVKQRQRGARVDQGDQLDPANTKAGREALALLDHGGDAGDRNQPKTVGPTPPSKEAKG